MRDSIDRYIDAHDEVGLKRFMQSAGLDTDFLFERDGLTTEIKNKDVDRYFLILRSRAYTALNASEMTNPPSPQSFRKKAAKDVAPLAERRSRVTA